LKDIIITSDLAKVRRHEASFAFLVVGFVDGMFQIVKDRFGHFFILEQNIVRFILSEQEFNEKLNTMPGVYTR
jgi:hypothetical protein